MDWNIILYIGMFFIVSGFGLFLYSEMKIREIDRKLFLNEQLHKAFMEAKKQKQMEFDFDK
tara:strand:- start:579 stop:761 length:183 start_codon:yes stop_codon:yes gene_type:complete